jgi:nitrate reductase gamma subunit
VRTWNTFLFGVFPYIAILLAVFGSIYRYFAHRFSYSSLSSQLLENRALFWGSLSWHYAIIPILLAHLFSGIFPGVSAAILGSNVSLFIFEWLGYALAYMAAFGLAILIARRIVFPKIFAVTSLMDWILLADLALQVVVGSTIAISYRWGSLWYLRTAVPWFWSLVSLNPDYSSIINLPWLVKLHMFNGFVVILLFPFTRLAHLVTVPVTYLWRPFQVVIWNRRPAG